MFGESFNIIAQSHNAARSLCLQFANRVSQWYCMEAMHLPQLIETLAVAVWLPRLACCLLCSMQVKYRPALCCLIAALGHSITQAWGGEVE